MLKHLPLLLSVLFTFTLVSLQANNFYWVGGNGNWNESSHWSFSSGGNGGAGIPSSNDDVYFDSNSFQSTNGLNLITVSGNQSIRNFNVINSPYFKLKSYNRIDFEIKGNWNVQSNFRNLIAGTFIFTGNYSHTISTKSFFNADVIFNNTGNYSLLTDLNLQDKSLQFISGNFTTSGKIISANKITIEENTLCLVDFSNSIIETSLAVEYSNALQQHLILNNKTVLLDRQFYLPDNTGAPKTVKNCGTGPGQTPFTITTSVTTNYNGENVSCNGASDATVCVSIVGGVGPFNVVWVGGPSGLFGSGAECWSGRDAGTYSVVVTDLGQGSAPIHVPCNTNIGVTEPELITLFSWTSTDPSCNGVCDGTAAPFIIGGVSPYTFAWSTGETNGVATLLCVGQNDLTITDFNGCVFDTTFFILTPTPVVPNLSKTDASCFGVCDGTITSTPTGGNGAPYTFVWSNGDVGPGPLVDSTVNLCDGTYSVIVTDNNGCTGNQSITITEPLKIILTFVSKTNLICNGVCSGAINISTANGTPPYTYQWFDVTTGLPVVGQTSEDASNMCAGTFFVQVTDANGCQDVSANIILTQPPAITITPTSTNILCFATCTGTLSAVSIGGTGTHDYQWFNAAIGLPMAGLTSANENGVCAGNYFVEVTDDNGCIQNSSVVSITEPAELILTVNTVDVLCNTACTGSASASAIGGTGGYTFQWFQMPNTNIGSGASISNLCSGNYFCRVTDGNNCKDTIQFTINEPNALTVVAETSTDVNCFNACDGTTTYDITGGTAPYVITWFDANTDIAIGQTGITATNLCPGSYYAIAEDFNNCTIQSNDLIITQPNLLSVAITHTDMSCLGVCDGTADLTITGGTLPYTIVWEDNLGNPIGQSADPAINLCDGTYHADITDANGCTITSANITVIQPASLTGTVVTTDVSCNGVCDGTAIATPAGGIGPFTFSWSTSANTTNTEINLCAGNFNVNITDNNGCQFGPINFTINQNAAFNFNLTLTDPTCFGSCDGSATVSNITGEAGIYTLDWSSSANTTPTENNLCAQNYTLTITDQNGCDTVHDFTINDQTLLVLNPTFADPSCLNSCDGTASANPTGATPPYSFVWVDLGTGLALGTATDTISNLCAGDYEVTVTDANGCFEIFQYALTDPPGMTATTIPTAASCGAVCDGSIDLTIINGTAPLTITWFDATSGTSIGQNSNPAINLCAGNYYAVVTDASGCSAISDTSVLNQVIVVTGTLVATDPSCFGTCDGSINLTPNGGNLPYTFAWFDQSTGLPIGQSTEDATGLCEGDYFVVITEAIGCSSAPLIENLNDPTEVTITLTVTNASCFGVCDGSITSVIVGGTAPYSFQWFNATTGIATGQISQNASSLCEGDYELIVTDANGCSFTSNTVTIAEPPQLVGTLTTTDATCFGVCNGTAFYSIVGGAAPYSFVWSSSANTTDTEINLCDGNYTVGITDASGCTLPPLAFSIAEPLQISANTTDGTVLCFGDCNGSVSIVGAGGTFPYTYLWNDGAAQTTPVASNLCAGTYDVIITDANGCNSLPFSADVAEPIAISLNTITSTDATCGGVCDGTATVTAIGGTGAYSFLWNDPLAQTTQTAISLCAGSYNVTVTDANGCSLAPQNSIVNEPTTLTVTVTATDESCFGVCDGTATAVIVGGTGITTSQWDDPNIQTTAFATSLCGGTYTVDVTDANGCTASASGTIISAVDITAVTSGTNAQCGVCDGTATVTPSGGTGTLDILWEVAAASQITTTATALCGGVYQATITDDNGCTQTFSAAVSNPNGETLNISATDASCEGVCDGTTTVNFNCGTPACALVWNDPGAQTINTATGLCAGSYGVTVTNGAGCISAAVIDVNEPLNIEANVVSTDAICNGDCNGVASSVPTGGNGSYTWLWNDPTSQTNPAAVNLCAGIYSVTVTDGNGCTGVGSVIVNDPVILDVTTAFSDASCNAFCDGTATAFPTGGLAPYTYQWDDPAAQTTQIASGLCAGTYNLTVVDASGCTFGPITVTINEPQAITGNISSTAIDCFGNCNGTATLAIAGGSSPFTFLWDDPLTQTSAIATNLCDGTYNVVATDINGCNSTPFSISIAEPIALTVSVIGTNPDCSGLCNGNADATIIGGTTPYSILWDDPSSQTTSLASNLCAGTFNIDVTDANGCVQSGSAILTAPIGITSNSTFTDETCFELCDGSATVNPSGGTLPYTVVWSDGSSTNTISNLCAGTYDVDITDANGCNTSETITIDPSIEITSTFTFANSTCGSCIGSALVTPAGGVPGYTYQWDAAAGGGTSQNISNLCAGVFAVDITDAAGCTETVGVSISDNNAELVTIIPTDASCFDLCDGAAIANTACVDGPCTLEWFDGTGTSTGIFSSNLSNLCADDYFVEVTNASGCITIENTTINEPLEIEGNGIVTDAACGGVCDGSVVLTPSGGNGVFTFLWTDPGAQTTQSASSLCGGNVDVQITSGGCTITETYFINQPIAITASVVSTDAQCNGDCNATATLTVNDGVLPYSFTWDDGATQSTQAAINLCAGNYNASITDANGCNLILPVFVNEPIPLTASVSFNDVDCFGNCNGDATVIPAGGDAPYTIQWDDPALQTSLIATSLCAGNYNVMVTDANFCTTVPTPVTINENPNIVISATSTDVTCNSFCDGTITINAAGGDGTYQFSIDNGANFQAGNLFTNLCGGSYEVVVIDGNNCQSSLNVNMNEPTALSGTVDNFDATCNVINGSANAIPTGGTPNYSFEWLDAALVPIGQSTQGATGLSAGVYNVEITDASGCTTTLTATVSNFNGPTATLFATTQPVCNGDCNGAINMEITGGTGGYTYLWFAGGQTTEDLSNVCAGNYTLQVTDAVGCLSFANATLNENDVIDATFVVTDATCGACDGASTITPTGGDGFYSILWTNGDSGLSSTNLCAGAYGAQVTDGLGCEQTINFAVSNPTGPTSETIISTDASCFGVCDGTADVTPIGGTAPYTFFWLHDASTSNTVSNLCPGTYFCEITDANDCIRVSEITINDAAQIIDSTNITPADCGVCNGGLQIFASGGNGPFSFQWNVAAGSVTTQTVSNLCEGIYSVTVTDGNGCTDSFTYSVNGKNAPQISTITTDANCNGSCDGIATVFTVGGAGPFVETWMDDNGTNLGLAGPSVNTLCEGDYIVQILDQATGCLTATNFTIDQPDSLQFSLPFLQDNSCFASCDGQLEAIVINGTLPFTYQWDNPASSTSSDINSLCAGTYNVIVTDANGCTDSQSGTINEPTEVTMAFVITDASCSTVADGAIDVTAAGGAGGYTYSWTGPNNFTSISEDLTNIFTGMYYLTTTDANGCSFTDSAFVNALIIVNADAGNDTTICGNLNTFTVNGNGGVTYEWFDLAGNSLSTSPSYTFNPTPGTTTLVLVAANGLCIGRDTIIIGIFTPPNADAGEDVFTAFGIPISFGGNPTGTAGTSLNWSPGVDLNDSTIANPTAAIDTTTTFIVTVSDANGCVDADTVVVEVLSPIFIPNGFSPNGDGPNDVWEIDFIEYFPECQVEVYNRWGQLLFISVGYQIPWDGKYEDKEVPIGTYYYVINLNNPLFPDAYTGPLTILR